MVSEAGKGCRPGEMSGSGNDGRTERWQEMVEVTSQQNWQELVMVAGKKQRRAVVMISGQQQWQEMVEVDSRDAGSW